MPRPRGENPTRPPTLARVAAHAGVSPKTASRALRGEPHVSATTLAEVVAAAANLGYQRNVAASLLASGRLPDSIGLITGDFTNPFNAALANAIENEISNCGARLALVNSRESAVQERRAAHDLADRRMKAVIVASVMSDHSEYAQLQARGVPVVFAGRPAENLAADSVAFDNREGGRLAGRHLVETGHRRIAYIGDPRYFWIYRQHVAGMADVIHDTTSGRHLLQTQAYDSESSSLCARALLALAEPPTAVVAGNSRILLGLMDEILGRVSMPAVVSFDDPEWAQFLGVSVVSGAVDELGRHAARLAIARLTDRRRSIENVVLPMRFTARQSAASRREPRRARTAAMAGPVVGTIED